MREFWLRTIHQSYFVVACCIGVTAGMVVGLIFRINYFASLAWCVAAGLALMLALVWPRVALVIVAAIAGMVIAFFRVALELEGAEYVSRYWGRVVIVSGTVVSDPATTTSGVGLKLSGLKLGEDEHEARGNIYVSARGDLTVRQGDRVRVMGKMEEGFGTYVGYMYRPRLLKIMEPNPPNPIIAVRDWFAGRVRKLLPEREANLGLSYLLGMKSNLDEGLSENLRVVGLMHIVVASGAHLAILVEVAKKAFSKLSRRAGAIFSVFVVVMFMALVGWTPSIMRAGIMAILTIITWFFGRKIAPWRMIVLVVALTLMIEPMFVVDLGWQLSFASYAGIVLLAPEIQKFFYGEKKPGFVAGLVLVTVAATLMTLPITLYYYGTVSLIAIAANLMILPTLPYAMGAVFASGVVAGMPVVADVVGFVAAKVLEFHIVVVEFFGGMSQLLVEIPAYQTCVFGLYLIIVGPFVVKYGFRRWRTIARSV